MRNEIPSITKQRISGKIFFTTKSESLKAER